MIPCVGEPDVWWLWWSLPGPISNEIITFNRAGMRQMRNYGLNEMSDGERERERENQHNKVCVWCWICCNLNISDLGVSKLQHSLVHLNNSHFRLILDEISKSLLSISTHQHLEHESQLFRHVIFCDGIFSCTVCVCVMGWWRLIWVMIQLVHHRTPRTELSIHGAEA